MAKTDWKFNDIVTETDMNELGQEVNDNLEKVDTHTEATTDVHGATSGAEPNTISQRTEEGDLVARRFVSNGGENFVGPVSNDRFVVRTVNGSASLEGIVSRLIANAYHDGVGFKRFNPSYNSMMLDANSPGNKLIVLKGNKGNEIFKWDYTEYVPTATANNLTLYVRIDGNDNNDGLSNSASGAFKTIAAAIAIIPNIVDHAIVINVAAGTYNEEIALRGFIGKGSISIIGAAARSSSVNYRFNNFISEKNTVRVILKGFEFLTAPLWANSSSIFIYDNPGYVSVQYCRSVFVGSDKIGAFAITSPVVSIYDCEISNKSNAILCAYSSGMIAETISGVGNNVAYTAQLNAKLTILSSLITSNVPMFADTGGMIVNNANSVINPWGDNTASAKSYVEAAHTSSAVSLPTNVITRLAYATIGKDHLGEWTGGNRFTAKTAGPHHIAASIQLMSVAAGSNSQLIIYVNGIYARTLGSVTNNSAGYVTISGSTLVYLNVGDIIDFYGNCTASCVTNMDGRNSWLSISRV
ncbi:pectinesterase family protein [Paenibacillus sp. Leaf72]|uniref:pectinesterase family protein n=1 Tax=Paenibacillus sp. Leaf72 TaxID=1736234 RepID=UPI000701C612|nr:pectinesterase family protein [Paenibacillus sp. Leaf72]KQN96250.1 hypothetical protein ASF12_25895 [Paenibacillus sp. Leaf72]